SLLVGLTETSAYAMGVTIPPAQAVVVWPRRVGVAVIGRCRITVRVGRRVVAVVAGRIVRVRRIISAVIPAVIVRPCKRAADDGPDGEGAEGRAPPAPAGICRGRGGHRRDTDRCRRGNSGQGFSHGVTSVMESKSNGQHDPSSNGSMSMLNGGGTAPSVHLNAAIICERSLPCRIRPVCRGRAGFRSRRIRVTVAG